MPTIKDVAKHCGVSISTVSIVLNGHEKERKIPQSTVDLVREAIEALGYRPNKAARTLRGAASKPVIALFWVLDRRSTFFMRLVRGIEEALSREDFPCELVIHPYVNGKLHEQKRVLCSDDYQGILIGALGAADTAYLESLPISIPLVVINRESHAFPCCYTDVKHVGQIAAAFARNHGCERLGVATDVKAVMPKTTRRERVIAACKEAGLACPDACIAARDNSVAGGMEAAEALLALDCPPDIIYVDNDIMAIGVSLQCRMHGYTQIPILCICLNHPEIGRHMTPPISLIDIPGEELGRGCAEMMVQLLKQEAPIENRVCACRLLEN